ncbi:hypothetical protein L873DRAFT_874364 [Choiromyces venosus 120613-1]|uniref:Uncharacterized protein n=1 Tax=Choiromyces venosus 120613-1 TaxID=1336337 RepID=A0A3N4JN85_9PEZI|nr:hypothetical protein L873DRAFT_874364 [Choiromyces venosus 120613-1]
MMEMIADGMRVLGDGMGIMKGEPLKRMEDIMLGRENGKEVQVRDEGTRGVHTGPRVPSLAVPSALRVMKKGKGRDFEGVGEGKGVKGLQDEGEHRRSWLVTDKGKKENMGVYGGICGEERLLKEALEWQKKGGRVVKAGRPIERGDGLKRLG